MGEYKLVPRDELYHYGVIGMKWGIRRGRASQAYSKGVKKLKKLDAKANNTQLKSDKLSAKSAKQFRKARGNSNRIKQALKTESHARKFNYKASRYQDKGRKFYKKMEKEFANISVNSLNKEDVEYGKRYSQRVLS